MVAVVSVKAVTIESVSWHDYFHSSSSGCSYGHRLALVNSKGLLGVVISPSARSCTARAASDSSLLVEYIRISCLGQEESCSKAPISGPYVGVLDLVSVGWRYKMEVQEWLVCMRSLRSTVIRGPCCRQGVFCAWASVIRLHQRGAEYLRFAIRCHCAVLALQYLPGRKGLSNRFSLASGLIDRLNVKAVVGLRATIQFKAIFRLRIWKMVVLIRIKLA